MIEDLFEVSKATSNNIVLHPMEVDVVNLLKQVAVEHTERFAAKGLTLRWDVPEEKVIVVLDNQKTFRIFENLFVNIQKYAMPQSRVYVQVHTSGEAPEKFVEITIKNMSATELNFDPRKSRSASCAAILRAARKARVSGLAIARSFTEAQGGKLSIEVDGDLFKVVIRLKCGTLQVEKRDGGLRHMESMDDYKEELEASFRRIREGDILTGTVIDVNEEGVTLDSEILCTGIYQCGGDEQRSGFSLAEAVHVGDTIEATVIRVDDGAGNILLSRREANEEQAWEKLKEMMEEGTTVTVRIKGEREGRRCGIS